MARPTKNGLAYYPMDVGFLRDKKVKLLRAEFGASSVLFVLYVFGKAYEGDGYFLAWDKDELLIASDELRESPAYISEVLQGCLSRSLFDERVFQMFGVLTSAGIQRRYLRGCEKRDDITVIKEYWLLDDNSKDVPASIQAKLTQIEVSGVINPVNSPGNSVNSPGNPQSKVKKSKVKKSKVKESERETLSPTLTPSPIPQSKSAWKPPLPEGTETRFSSQMLAVITDWLTHKHEKRQDYKPTGLKSVLTQIEKKTLEFGEAAVIDVIQLSMSNNWQGIIWDRIKPENGQVMPLKNTKGEVTNGITGTGTEQRNSERVPKFDEHGWEIL